MRWVLRGQLRRAALVVCVAAVMSGACKREATGESESKSETHLDGAVVELDVSVRADGSFTVDGHPLADEDALVARTREMSRATPILHAVIHVDETVAYDRVISAMAALKRGGVGHMTLAVAGTLDASH